MAGTRSSARLAGHGSSPSSSQNSFSPKATAGTKRKPDTASPSQAKRGKKNGEKKQTTIEEAMAEDPEDEPKEESKEEPKEESQEEPKLEFKEETTEVPKEESKEEPAATAVPDTEKNGESHVSADDAKIAEEKAEKENHDESTKEHADTTKPEQNGTANGDSHKASEEPSKKDDTAVEAGQRDQETPSSILEKGIIYFFFRARVNIDEPHTTDDIARSYIVMRPIPHGAKLGEGPIGDAGNCRLLALPKKVLPLSGKDRFMTFVEKAKTSFTDLKDNFMSASDYATKTAGTSHTPPVTPVGEGIYALTTTGRESHLAYILTIPNKLDQVQQDIGLRERGSFITSLKNPDQKGPANASLPQGPDYPKEIMDEFRGRRWMSLEPAHLDYANAQLLLIGESSGLDHATEPHEQSKNEDTPLQEMEKLEGEDEIRVSHLNGDDAVFADLGLDVNEYPKVQTTW